MRVKILSLGIFVFLLAMILPSNASASEGFVELRSTNNQDYRCHATSILMRNAEYTILVGCRDLIYPPQEDVFIYIAWSTPLEGGNPQKLGALGVGKVVFKTNTPFNSIFVTTEQDTRVRSPEGDTVMRGSISPITFLESEVVPTPTPTDNDVSPNVVEEPEQDQTSTRQRLLTGLKRAGLVSFLALIGVIALVFVVTRPKS